MSELNNAAPPEKNKRRRGVGQALIEYVLIISLVVLAVVAILTATGPWIGNVFSNVVVNLLQETTTPYATLNQTQFWNYVTAVAQYTPPAAPTQPTLAASQTNSPAPTTPGASPTFTNTPTITSTPTSTVTVGPSPTATDASFIAPVLDNPSNDLPNAWHTLFTDAFNKLPWSATYYSGASWSGGVSGGAQGSTYLCTAPLSTSTACESDVNFTYGTGGIGGSGGNAIKFTGVAPLEGRLYQVALTVGPNDGAVFKINGTAVVTVSPGEASAVTSSTFTTEFATWQQGANLNNNVEVDYYYGNTVQSQVALNFSILPDAAPNAGACAWQANSSPSYTIGGMSQSWQYGVNPAHYSVSANCYIRWRASIDIHSLSHPYIKFFDQWSFGPGAIGELLVRDYNFNSNNPWQVIQVHGTGSKNANWGYDWYDLTNFGGHNFLSDPDKKVEVAFAVIDNSTTFAQTDLGWYLDSVAIDNYAPNIYKLVAPGGPQLDDSDSNKMLGWIPECNWQRTSEMNYPTGSPGNSWHSNPFTVYSPNSDCSLILDGLVDLTPFSSSGSLTPQLTFYNQYNMVGTTDALTVEYALSTTPTTWVALTPSGSSNPYIVQGTSTVASWASETFDLSPLDGKQADFRFHMHTDSTSPGGGGWFLDNILFQAIQRASTGLPFAENFDNSAQVFTNWQMSDQWGLTTASDPPANSGQYALTNTPGGSSTSTGGDANNWARFRPDINMTSPGCPTNFKPLLQFWSHWNIASGTTLYVEGSQNQGQTWPLTLWSYTYNQTNLSFWDPYNGAGSYNNNKDYRRFTVDLTNVGGTTNLACDGSHPALDIRFRLQTTTTTTADSWYIDDFGIYDATAFDQNFTDNDGTSAVCTIAGICNPSPLRVLGSPFNDNADGSGSTAQQNWYMGGDWNVETGAAHSPPGGFYSSPSSTGQYQVPEDGIMEIAKPIDLTGFSGSNKPVVSFWTRYNTNAQHHLDVEESSNPDAYNPTWVQLSWINTVGNTPGSGESGTNMGWTRQVMDLSPYDGQVVHLRFRLDALNTNSNNEKGWWMDNVYVGPMTGLPGYNNYTAPFADNFANTFNWVTEGDWQGVNDWGPYYYDLLDPGLFNSFTSVSHDYGNGNLNNQWNADFYHYYSFDPNWPNQSSTPIGTPIQGEPNPNLLCNANGTSTQISDVSVLPSDPNGNSDIVTSNDGTMPLFAYSDDVYNNNQSGTGTGIRLNTPGAGEGFQFTAVADNTAVRTLNLFVGVKGGSASNPTNAQVTASISGFGVSGSPYTTTISSTSTSFTTSAEITISYEASSANQLLTVSVIQTGTGGGTGVKLEGAELLMGSQGSPSVTGTVTNNNLNQNTTFNMTNDVGANGDWAHWGANGARQTLIDRKTYPACIKAIQDVPYSTITFNWTNNAPANATGNAVWSTDNLDGEFFGAVFTRYMTVTKTGHYRFWIAADDGVAFKINNALQAPNTSLPYPWTSARANAWQEAPAQGETSYFYDVNLTASANPIPFEVDYFQGHGNAALQFQVSEPTTMLLSNPLGNYTGNQDTGAYLSGPLNVATTGTTTLSFYERYQDGDNGGTGDPMYVGISTDGGFTWTKLTPTYLYDKRLGTKTYHKTPPYTVPYTNNLGDQAGSVDPFDTFQNWHQATVDITSLITSSPTQIEVKFELDARNSVTQGAGWYITGVQVTQP